MLAVRIQIFRIDIYFPKNYIVFLTAKCRIKIGLEKVTH